MNDEPVDRALRAAMQATPEHDDEMRHWYRVPEFPVALCGHISPLPNLASAMVIGAGRPVCPRCSHLFSAWLALKKAERKDEHGHAGTEAGLPAA